MAASTHDTKRAIMATIEDLGGEARQVTVAHAMGPEWMSPPKYAKLRQTMRRMVAEYILTTPRRGVYAVHPTLHRRGLDARDHTVRQIERFLVSRCGAAKTGEIHNTVAARDMTDGARDAEHKRVTLALAQTPEKFCQPYGSGVWALTAEARERLPLLGWWAELEFPTRDHDAFFAKVGEAFSDARADRTVEAVTAQRGIREALCAMANAAPDAKHELLRQMRKDVEREAGGMADAFTITMRCIDRQDYELPIYTYLAFESGDARLHLVATPEFYRETAALFGVDAARLSRGKVVVLARSRDDRSGDLRSSPPSIP